MDAQLVIVNYTLVALDQDGEAWGARAVGLECFAVARSRDEVLDIIGPAIDFHLEKSECRWN